MADAVDLVRAYLHLNGYFTVSEYPVVEQLRGGSHRMVTDLDILAFRFPAAGTPLSTSKPGHPRLPALLEPDPALGGRKGESDMIVGEVKTGHAELNHAARDPRVLEIALVRFGCCGAHEMEGVVAQLLQKGEASTGHGHRVRMVAFGSTVPQKGPSTYSVIAMGHIVAFLRSHLRENWDLIRHAQVSDPALGFLSLLEKAELGSDG